MCLYVINGKFLTEKITGVQRYAIQIIRELDKIVEKDSICIAVPPFQLEQDAQYKNIKIITVGHHSGIYWEQVEFYFFLKKNKMKSLNLCNTVPLLSRGGIATIHDISYKINFKKFKGIRNKLSALWHCFHYSIILQTYDTIITVSNVSKSEITTYFSVDDNKIAVIYNAWQHINDITISHTFEILFPQLKMNEYYLSLSSAAWNKNFKYIYALAKAYPEKIFVIAGSNKGSSDYKKENYTNLHFMGYVTDEQLKLLMANSSGFIFPSIYEGFGIPPLEAVACGIQKIFVSDIPVMHEVYGDNANYFNPYDIETLHFEDASKISDNRVLLNQYSWEKSAKSLLALLMPSHDEVM